MGVVDKLNELNVEEGTSKRFDCIFCGKKNTLSVTKKKGKLLWNCFSASCNARGNVGVDFTKDDLVKEVLNKNHEAELKPFSFPASFTMSSCIFAIVLRFKWPSAPKPYGAGEMRGGGAALRGKRFSGVY